MHEDGILFLGTSITALVILVIVWRRSQVRLHFWKRAEGRVEEVGGLLESVLCSMDDLILVVNRNLKIVRSNWYGIDKEKRVEGASCFFCVHGRDEVCPDCIVRRVFDSGQAATETLKGEKAGRTMEVRAFPIRDSGQAITLVVVVLRDISALKRDQDALNRTLEELNTNREEMVVANAELRRSQISLECLQRKYHDLYMFSPLAYFTFDSAGYLVEVNIQGCDLLGIETNVSNHHQSLHRYLANDCCRELMAHVRVAMIAQTKNEHDLKLVRHDGVEWDVRMECTRFEDPVRGEPVCFVVMVDVTARRQAERALRENKERLEVAMAVSNIGTWFWDTSTNNDTRDARFNRILGLPARESTQPVEDFFSYVHPADRERVQSVLQETLAGHTHYNCDLRIVRADGAVRWLHDEGHVFLTPEGELSHMTGAVVDITERKEAENELKRTLRELRRSNEELEQFTYVASHDLNEPLRKVEAFADRLRIHGAAQLDDKGQEYIRRMCSAVDRMRKLIEDLLGYSRVARGECSWEAVDLQAVLAGVVDVLEVRIEDAGAKVEVGEGLPVVYGDASQLGQVFQNLLSNALKFVEPGQSARVRVQCSCCRRRAEDDGEGMCRIDIADEGIGIPPEYLDEIFQPFRRLHRREEYAGSGIGLAICKKVIERHGGALTVDSVAGRGSVFHVDLPVRAPLAKELVAG